MKTKNIKISMLILIVLILIIGIILINNTEILKRIRKDREQMLEQEATTKLEQALEIAKTRKETDENYNNAEYLENILKEQSIGIYGNIAIVNDYNFEIDRENLNVTRTIGKTNVSIETKVVKLLDKSANGKQRAQIEIIVTSNTPLDNIIFENENGTFDKQKAEELTYTKKMEIGVLVVVKKARCKRNDAEKQLFLPDFKKEHGQKEIKCRMEEHRFPFFPVLVPWLHSGTLSPVFN